MFVHFYALFDFYFDFVHFFFYPMGNKWSISGLNSHYNLSVTELHHWITPIFLFFLNQKNPSFPFYIHLFSSCWFPLCFRAATKLTLLQAKNMQAISIMRKLPLTQGRKLLHDSVNVDHSPQNSPCFHSQRWN